MVNVQAYAIYTPGSSSKPFDFLLSVLYGGARYSQGIFLQLAEFAAVILHGYTMSH